MHIVKYRDSLPSAVQKRLNRSRCSLKCWVEWIQETYYMEMQITHRKGTFGASGRLKSTVKHRIMGAGLGKRMSKAKNS